MDLRARKGINHSVLSESTFGGFVAVVKKASIKSKHYIVAEILLVMWEFALDINFEKYTYH